MRYGMPTPSRVTRSIAPKRRPSVQKARREMKPLA
jgi:hypothetical protein